MRAMATAVCQSRAALRRRAGILPPWTKENWLALADDAAQGRGEAAGPGAVDDHLARPRAGPRAARPSIPNRRRGRGIRFPRPASCWRYFRRPGRRGSAGCDARRLDLILARRALRLRGRGKAERWRGRSCGTESAAATAAADGGGTLHAWAESGRELKERSMATAIAAAQRQKSHLNPDHVRCAGARRWARPDLPPVSRRLPAREAARCYARSAAPGLKAGREGVNRRRSFQRRTVRRTRYPVPGSRGRGRIAGAARAGSGIFRVRSPLRADSRQA